MPGTHNGKGTNKISYSDTCNAEPIHSFVQCHDQRTWGCHKMKHLVSSCMVQVVHKVPSYSLLTSPEWNHMTALWILELSIIVFSTPCLSVSVTTATLAVQICTLCGFSSVGHWREHSLNFVDSFSNSLCNLETKIPYTKPQTSRVWSSSTRNKYRNIFFN